MGGYCFFNFSGAINPYFLEGGRINGVAEGDFVRLFNNYDAVAE